MSCGAVIYFDAHSSVGHPTPDKWIPLEYKEGRKTDTIHNCPNKKQNGSSTCIGNNNSSAATAATPSKLDLDSLALIKVIAAALNEYIAIKENPK